VRAVDGVIPRGLIIVAPSGALWIAYHFVGSIRCQWYGMTASDAVNGLVAWIDENLVGILQRDPTIPYALATVH